MAYEKIDWNKNFEKYNSALESIDYDQAVKVCNALNVTGYEDEENGTTELSLHDRVKWGLEKLLEAEAKGLENVSANDFGGVDIYKQNDIYVAEVSLFTQDDAVYCRPRIIIIDFGDYFDVEFSFVEQIF